MAFAQLTYRESLRDIEICLLALHKKLYHSGFRGVMARSTLADANDHRVFRAYQRGGVSSVVREPSTCATAEHASSAAEKTRRS